jgi:hypothetical protein
LADTATVANGGETTKNFKVLASVEIQIDIPAVCQPMIVAGAISEGGRSAKQFGWSFRKIVPSRAVGASPSPNTEVTGFPANVGKEVRLGRSEALY